LRESGERELIRNRRAAEQESLNGGVGGPRMGVFERPVPPRRSRVGNEPAGCIHVAELWFNFRGTPPRSSWDPPGRVRFVSRFYPRKGDENKTTRYEVRGTSSFWQTVSQETTALQHFLPSRFAFRFTRNAGNRRKSVKRLGEKSFRDFVSRKTSFQSPRRAADFQTTHFNFSPAPPHPPPPRVGPSEKSA
jgi:hypothetical protein